MTFDEQTVIARWEGRGAHWVELRYDPENATYSYRGACGGGFLGALAHESVAIDQVEKRVVPAFTPDRNKNPLRRVR